MKNTSHVSASIKFLPVKDAALYLQVKVGQIKHLITQDLIDSKLENGTTVVNINSIDESVMIDLKKRENVYPKRQDYKLKSNKTIDKKIVINSIIDNMNNSSNEVSMEYKKDFENLCGSYGVKRDDLKIQSFLHKILSLYHTEKNYCMDSQDYMFNYAMSFHGETYTIITMEKEDTKFEYGFYFLDTKKYEDSVDKIMTSLTVKEFYNLIKNKENIIFDESENAYNLKGTCIKYMANKISKYISENHLFYLTLDEFIKEFSPAKYYEKNKLWSMYLAQEEASNDEEISRSPMKHHKVRGFWRNQPYGSKEDRKSKMTWIDPFERGGKKVKMAA